jgi:hypothetical protein
VLVVLPMLGNVKASDAVVTDVMLFMSDCMKLHQFINYYGREIQGRRPG